MPNEMSCENWQENERQNEMKNDILRGLYENNVTFQTFRHAVPHPTPLLGRLGLEVQHHAAHHNKAPEDATFQQRDQGSSDLVMHFRQPEVYEHSV